MVYKKKLIQVICLLLCASTIKAQTLEVGINGGGAGYIGDFNPKLLKISGVTAGAYLKAHLNPYWSLGLHYQYGKIKASDANSENAQYRDRNLSFYTPLNEVSLQMEFNFLEYFAGGGPKYFSPYIFAGVGGVMFNPKTTYQGQEYQLSFYRTEGQKSSYKHYAMTIPFGAGVHFRLKENWGLFTQVGYRTAQTDYLDDVSGRYVGATAWGPQDVNTPTRMALSDRSGEKTGVYLGTPGTQRGDFRKNDTYMFLSIGISYTFFSEKCYNF